MPNLLEIVEAHLPQITAQEERPEGAEDDLQIKRVVALSRERVRVSLGSLMDEMLEGDPMIKGVETFWPVKFVDRTAIIHDYNGSNAPDFWLIDSKGDAPAWSKTFDAVSRARTDEGIAQMRERNMVTLTAAYAQRTRFAPASYDDIMEYLVDLGCIYTTKEKRDALRAIPAKRGLPYKVAQVYSRSADFPIYVSMADARQLMDAKGYLAVTGQYGDGRKIEFYPGDSLVIEFMEVKDYSNVQRGAFTVKKVYSTTDPTVFRMVKSPLE